MRPCEEVRRQQRERRQQHRGHAEVVEPLTVDAGLGPHLVGRDRAAGLDVTASQYPWDASGTSLVASLVPLWAQDGGRKAMLARFDDPEQAQRLRTDMAENLRRRGGAESLLIVEGRYRNQRLAAVALA